MVKVGGCLEQDMCKRRSAGLKRVLDGDSPWTQTATLHRQGGKGGEKG